MTAPTAPGVGVRASAAPSGVRSPLAGSHDAVQSRAMAWLPAAVLFAATSVVVGVIWDISWHTTIGRDTFWTPAHLTIYLGGLVGGLAGGVVALKTTFAGSAEERAVAVRFWGFRAPLGAWVSIWGAFAMLTSAPFDDWWHNAYGLDVEILSPPHIVLALGMVALAAGAMMVTLAAQNRAPAGRERGFGWMYAYAAGCVLSFLAIMTTEYSYRSFMHASLFYRVSCAAFPWFLIAAGNASRLRWGAMAVALSYTAIRLAMGWILPLFAASPGLGPIYQDVTHMVPMDFPLLLIVPAFFMDVVRQRRGSLGDWSLALVQGAVFFITFLAVQWPFASFLIGTASRNPVFFTDNWYYGLPKSSGLYRGLFLDIDPSPTALALGLGVALLTSLLSASLGAAAARWMRRVQR